MRWNTTLPLAPSGSCIATNTAQWYRPSDSHRLIMLRWRSCTCGAHPHISLQCNQLGQRKRDLQMTKKQRMLSSRQVLYFWWSWQWKEGLLNCARAEPEVALGSDADMATVSAHRNPSAMLIYAHANSRESTCMSVCPGECCSTQQKKQNSRSQHFEGLCVVCTSAPTNIILPKTLRQKRISTIFQQQGRKGPIGSTPQHPANDQKDGGTKSMPQQAPLASQTRSTDTELLFTTVALSKRLSQPSLSVTAAAESAINVNLQSMQFPAILLEISITTKPPVHRNVQVKPKSTAQCSTLQYLKGNRQTLKTKQHQFLTCDEPSMSSIASTPTALRTTSSCQLSTQLAGSSL